MASVFDGAEVRTFVNGVLIGTAPGDHTLRWDGRDDRGRATPAGAYFFRVRTPHGAESRPVTRIR